MRERIVILHGYNCTSKNMEPLANFMRQRDHEVVNVEYAFLKKLSDIIDELNNLISWEEDCRTSFIPYSLGARATHALYFKYNPKNFGRVCMLGPPNHGSELADRVSRLWFSEYFYGKAIQDMVTHPTSSEDIFGPVNFDLFVVAGKKTKPGRGHFFTGPNDGAVTVASTKLRGMREHILLDINHDELITDERVFALAADAIENGSFIKSAMQLKLTQGLSIYPEGGYQPVDKLIDITVDQIPYWRAVIENRIKYRTDVQLSNSAEVQFEKPCYTLI